MRRAASRTTRYASQASSQIPRTRIPPRVSSSPSMRRMAARRRMTSPKVKSGARVNASIGLGSWASPNHRGPAGRASTGTGVLVVDPRRRHGNARRRAECQRRFGAVEAKRQSDSSLGDAKPRMEGAERLERREARARDDDLQRPPRDELLRGEHGWAPAARQQDAGAAAEQI